MNSTAQRFHDAHLRCAQQAERDGKVWLAAYHRRCAATYAAPIGNLIAATFN